MSKNIKILICGEGRHGKDTVAELLEKNIGYSFESSSRFVGEKLYPKLKEKYGYKTFEECYEDRLNHRDEWYNLICEYNSPDKTRTAKELLSCFDIYVGMRDDEEFELSKHLFDLTIWVDASERLPSEPNTSNKLTKDMFSYVIYNNDSYEELLPKVDELGVYINKLKKYKNG